MIHSLVRSEFFIARQIPTIGLAAIVLATWSAVLLIFSADVGAALSIWDTNAAYSHCYLILPISLYLIYSRWAELQLVEAESSVSGAFIFAGCLTLWWIGMASSITELRQFALVGILQAVVICLLGWRFYRRIVFPMLFLFLMVPTGTVLLESLQTLTTVLSSFLLRLAGIPVFGEGHMIEVPHGLYEVAPGCAGLNFLLSTLALSLVYVSVVYRDPVKRVTVVAAALALSMLTNAIRVFGIIWLAEATERRIDIVDDHLLYGWGVYGAVMLLAMIVGYRFRDRSDVMIKRPHTVGQARMGILKLSSVAITMAILAGSIPASFAALNSPLASDMSVGLNLPKNMGGWVRDEADIALLPPLFRHPEGVFRSSYVKAGAQIDAQATYYWLQRDGHKITDPMRAFADNGDWVVDGRQREVIRAGAYPMEVEAIRLTRAGKHILLWSYYWVGGYNTANTLSARLLAMASAVGLDGRSATIVLSASDDDGRASSTLTDFLTNIHMLHEAFADASLRAN